MSSKQDIWHHVFKWESARQVLAGSVNVNVLADWRATVSGARGARAALDGPNRPVRGVDPAPEPAEDRVWTLARLQQPASLRTAGRRAL
jgi:hypothetical protein